VAVIELARNVAQLKEAHSTEFSPHTPYPVIALVTEWVDDAGQIQKRDTHSNLGGTMRLGGQLCHILPNSLAANLYKCNEIIERHRHRYEVNEDYVNALTAVGLRVSGRAASNNLVEIIELEDHPWFFACQFHPEFTSTPRDGHPIFTGFIAAAKQHQTMKEKI